MKRFLYAWIVFLLSGTIGACKKNNNEAISLSSAKQIKKIEVVQDSNASVLIDSIQHKIRLTLANTVNLDSLILNITISNKATLTPASGTVQNFSNNRQVNYTVTAEDGSKQLYEITARYHPSPDKEITAFDIPGIYQQGTIQHNSIDITVPFGTDVTKLIPQAKISAGANIEPSLDIATDFSKPVKYTVTAEDGSKSTYTVTVNILEQETAVRAVWIPDPSHTTVMHTYQNILNMVDLLDQLNFNTIYVASWARNTTSFKSQVLLNNSTYQTVDDGYFFKEYLPSYYNSPKPSPTGDPMKDLITAAHQRNIKVIMWFEYGFMAKAGQPILAQHPLWAKHPEWIARASDGTIANYNKTDYYFNAYDSAVQNFLLSLIEEALQQYPEIDGIQGDDRMPAMPRNSGYEPSTIARYKAEHQGQEPPLNYNDAAWVRWRLNILNNFGKKLYAKVKTINPKLIVCFSPNPYPWSMNNLMQEWPQWIADEIVEILSVQCYRNDIEAYKATVQAAKTNVNSKTSKNILNPGMILKNGSTIMPEDLLVAQLRANRALKTNGESQFYIEGLKNAKVQQIFKAFYPGKAKHPLQ